MSPPPPHLLFLSILALFVFFPPLLLASSSFPLPTIAIAAVRSNTSSSPHYLACALVPSDGDAAYDLSCASLTNRSAPPHDYSYGRGGTTPFSAVVAGDGYLCSAGPTANPTMSMRWWDVTNRRHGASSSKRVYCGAALSAVSGGGEYVCGLVEGRIQCWRWTAGTLPEDVAFSALAAGGGAGFVCGLTAATAEVRCYGEGDAVGREPRGKHKLIAAGERHACAVREGSGELACWGDATAVAAAAPATRVVGRAVSSVAVGDGMTCVLWGNWTVSCWPEAEASPPAAVARQQFVALEARGKAVCGVLMSDYSLSCWGPGVAEPSSKVFDRVLPGPCAPWASCQCGVWSGSAPLCAGHGGNGGSAVCYPCGYTPMALNSNSSSPAPGPDSGRNKRRMSDLAIALVSAGIGSGVMAALAAVLVAYCLRRRGIGGGGGAQDSGRIHAEPSLPRVERRLSTLLSKGPNTTVEQFPLPALRAATAGFSPSHRIGSGSFGTVYRARLPDGREVAIKRAEHRARRDRDPTTSSSTTARRVHTATNHHAEAAFVSELALLSRVNHKNLVRLLGFCADGSTGERILVYEYMPNGTLHDHLHKHAALPLSPPLATWPARLRLALGAARGIEYMHTYAVPPIIHRDIKSPNILLAGDWTAKVADFGLSLLNLNSADSDSDDPCLATAGTVGYMDPEYYRLQHLTDKSDVYSFGVVLLELLSGLRAVQRFEGSGTPKNVVDVTVPHIEADAVHRVLDARMPLPTPGEMEAVAYVGYLASDCVRPAGRDRPTMSEVVGVLERAVAACEDHEDAGDDAVLSRSCTDGSTTAAS